MHTLPWLSITIFLPLIGVFFILFIQENNEAAKRNIRSVALLTSLTVLGLACIDFSLFKSDISDFQLVESYQWLENFRAYYHIGVDGISILFVLLTAFLTPLAILSTWQPQQMRVKEYMIAFLILETMMLGTFCALDFILFYLFFEAVLIPMYLIIGIWGGGNVVFMLLTNFFSILYWDQF